MEINFSLIRRFYLLIKHISLKEKLQGSSKLSGVFKQKKRKANV